MIVFRHHNVMLPGSRQTRPGCPLTADREDVRQAVALLKEHIEPGSSVADIGCLEGGFSFEFARNGYITTGFEVRESNVARCNALAAAMPGLPLWFEHENCWNIGEHGTFEAVYCGGLLYHLDYPATFLRLLAPVTSQLLILNTHFAVESGVQQHTLSDITEHEGYLGRWYTEFPDDETFANREDYTLSSWDNRRSFWLLRSEIPKVLRDAGFHDVQDLGESDDTTGYNRSTFTAKAG